MRSWMSLNPEAVKIGTVPGATSTYPSRTTFLGGAPSWTRHCDRSFPSNSTMASDGGGTGGRSGPGSTTGGRGRSMEWTGQVWAVIVAGSIHPSASSAECGVRNVKVSVARRATFHGNSAFRIPHSALVLRFPRSLGHRRHEPFDARRWEIERLALFGALVRRHQELHDLQTVVERQQRSLPAEEYPHEVPVFGVVSVGRRLARYHGHEPHLGVLLLDQVLARLSLDLTAEEELEPAVQRIPRHGVFGAEQLGGEPQPGADEAPGRGRFADDGGAVVGLE